MTRGTFEEVWRRAAMKHLTGEVSVETFREILDETQISETLTC